MAFDGAGSGGDDTVAKEPTDSPFVTLAEALTWIAFRHSLDDAELCAAVIGVPVIDERSNDERLRAFLLAAANEPPAYAIHGLGPFLDREAALTHLAEAWRTIRANVDSDVWQIRGRYTPTYSLNEAQLAEPEVLPGSRIAAFSQFDITTGGIRRQPAGQPPVIWDGHPLAYEREWDSIAGDNRARDGYLIVEVRRDNLFPTFAEIDHPRAPSVKVGRPPPDDEILVKADEMKARGLTGYQIAARMRQEPGFANVTATGIRVLIKGRWKQCGRPEKKYPD